MKRVPEKVKKETDQAASTRNEYRVPIRKLKERFSKEGITAGTGLREFKRMELETTQVKNVKSC